MLRLLTPKPALAVAAAAVWSAAVLGFTMSRETPVGTIEGFVIGSDTGRPISGATIWLTPDEQEDWARKQAHTDVGGAFRFADIPAGDYTIEATAKVHHLQPAVVTLREGHVETLSLELAPAQPYLNLYVPQQMFTSGEQPELVLDGFTESDEVRIGIHHISTDRLLAGETRSIRHMLSGGWGEINSSVLAQHAAVDSIQAINVRITKRDSEGAFQERVTLPAQQPGIYVITARVDQIEQAGVISVSDISVVTKESGPDLLAYVVRIDSGEPVEGAEVTVLGEKEAIDRGSTGPDGIWAKRLDLPPGGRQDRVILARHGGSTAFVNTYGNGSSTGRITIYAYTDRPVYRPGQQVYFKGIVRAFSQDAYRTPGQGQTRVEVRDRRNSLVYAKSLPLSRFGSFHGDFKLPQYAPTGGYDVTCSFGGETQASYFTVAEYRKPEFSVSVEMPKKHCVRGEKIRAKVRASYYFGAPVVGAEVRYSVSRSDYWFWPEDEDYEYYDGEYGEYEDYGDYGETVFEGVARTGPDGTAEVEFSTYWETHDDEYAPNDQQFTLTAYVTDPSRREAEGEASIIAAQGEFRVNIEPEQYVAEPGGSARFRILAADYDKNPQAGVELDVVASRARWEYREERFTRTASAKVRTDSSGRAMFAFKPTEPGSYVVRSSCRDRRGNRIRSSTWLWVAGPGDYGGYEYPDLEVVLDKKVYIPGESAKVLINTREAGASALVTVEGRRLFDHRLVALAGRSTVVEVPIKPEYRPNFYIGVCFVKDKKFANRQARAKVSLDEQTVKLTVTPDKKKYQPGEEATYTVKAVDGHGRPVEAEVSLGVVDEAIYDIREESTPPIRDFFYAAQPNSVETRYSFPEVYLSGDKAGYTGKVRKEFVDTAFWYPDVVTDANGEARATFKLPDNLTTWRATARACTLDTAVGECTSSAVCSKDLLVRLETPRFLIQKDEAVISALVHNYLPDGQQVQVRLGAPGLKVRGRLSRQVAVPSDGMARVEWRVAAPGVGNAALTAYAVCPAASDAMQLTVPIRPHGQRLVETKAGSVSAGAVTERAIVRADSVAGASEIRVRLAPSLASAILGSLEYLAQYPYGCTEQTMSCFLPDVVIWRTLKSLGVSNPELERSLPDMVGKGLNRLYDFQNEDGGWGWCQYGQADSWMTAYVVFGLLTARQAGFEVNRDVLSRGIMALRSRLQSSSGIGQDTIYALYVLSMAGRPDEVGRRLKTLRPGQLADPRGAAVAALALANIGDVELARKHLARLWNMAIVSRGEIHWGQRDSYGEVPTETTALALMAAIRLASDDSRIPKVVRWILGRRERNHWHSTRDTAMILYALSDYLAQSRELEADFTATVLCNGRKIGALRLDRSSIFEPERELVIGPRDLAAGASTIRIEMAGTGVLYYTTELMQYVQRQDTPRTVTGSGIAVRREYRKLVPRWNEASGTTRIEPARSTSTDFRSGDVIRVRLIVNSPREYEHVLVEDYLPAGCEAFDRGRMEPWEWSYWWVDRDTRDERVSFYVERLANGRSVLEYEFRAGVPGSYHAMPPLVQAMYQPSIAASGVEDEVRIR